MNEERLDRMEVLLGDLIGIVGRTNAMVEEMRDELAGLREKVDSLQGEVKDLRSEVNDLRNEVKDLRGRTDSLQKDMDLVKSAMATKEDICLLNERLDLHMNKLARQEEDIYRLKRLVGIK